MLRQQNIAIDASWQAALACLGNNEFHVMGDLRGAPPLESWEGRAARVWGARWSPVAPAVCFCRRQ